MRKPPPALSDRALLDAFWSEAVVRTVLPNGLTLLVKPDRSAALASVQVWVRTGSIHEGTQLGAGLSHYLEHMLFKGTDRRSGRDISAAVQAHGGYINAYTTFDRTVYYIDLPSEHLEVAVDLLADAVLHSTLPAEEVTREKDVILREIAMTRDEPDTRLWESLFATAFREHPYRQPIIGHRDVFAATNRADLVAYYRERYVPNNLVVVVAGDVDPAAVRRAVEQHFGSAPRSRLAPVLVPAEPLQLGPRRVQTFEKVEIVRSALAWAVPGLTDPAAPKLDLLAMILGHGDSSVLWQEIRERQKLVHSIDASCWNPGSSGLFCVTYICDAGKRPAAEAAIVELLAKLQAPKAFSAEQIRKAYRQSVVAEINTRKTMSGQASRLGMAEVVVGDLEYSRTYFEALAAVQPADLAAAVRTFLVPSRLTVVSLEPEQAEAGPTGAAAVVTGIRPDFEPIELPNGARILLQPDHKLPNVHLRVVTFGGPLSEAPGRRGSAALLATLLTKDTARRSAAAVAERIEEVGGSFSSFSGDNSLGLAVEVLSTDVDRALDLLREALFRPAFAAGTLEIEREAQLAALREVNDDVVALARRRLRARFFGAHPFGIGPNGDEAGVQATTAADLRKLWRKLLVGPGVVLAAAGDFDPKVLRPKLEMLLKAIPTGTVLPAGTAFVGPAEPGDFVEQQPREQAVVLEAYPGAVLDAADYYAGEVLDELFSGMASRLFERVRDQKGLAYFVRSGRLASRGTAMFYFLAGTQPGKEKEVLKEIRLEIARVRKGAIPAAELARCQTRLKAGHRKAQQTNSARAMQAAIDVLQGRPANHSRQVDGLIDAVTVKDLAKFAREHLRPEAHLQLVVRP